MKIDYAIIGCDMNPEYLDFWPIVSKIWKEYFKITPVLGWITSEDSDFYEDEYGLIKKFKPIEGISTALQSQCIRHYLPKLLDGVCLITDIDMLPLSRKYFINDLEEYSNDKFIVLSSDHEECNRLGEIPMCYNAAHSKKYCEVLDIENISWEEFIKKLNDGNVGLPGHLIWNTDQRYLYKKVHSYEKQEDIISLKRGWDWGGGRANYRIDRVAWNYDENLVNKDYYIDCHSHRPLSHEYARVAVDKLMDLLFNQ